MRAVLFFLLFFASNTSWAQSRAEVGGFVAQMIVGQNADPATAPQAICLPTELLEPGTRFHEAAAQLTEDFPDAVSWSEVHLCILQSAIPPVRMTELFLLMKRLPSSILARADQGTRLLPSPDLPLETPVTPMPALEATTPSSTVNSIRNFATGATLSLAVLSLLPTDITHWEKGQSPQAALTNFKDAWTKPPVWDRDSIAMNFAAHPYVGMQTYLMERNYGRSILRSFLFSTGASIAWEYLFESWMERPSIQDLLFTSTLGSLLGEGNYQLTLLLRQNGFETWEKVIVTVLNPIYVIENGYQ